MECTRASGVPSKSQSGLSRERCESLKAQGAAYGGCHYSCSCSGGEAAGSGYAGNPMEAAFARGVEQMSYAIGYQLGLALMGGSPEQRAARQAEALRLIEEQKRQEEARKKELEERRAAALKEWRGGASGSELAFKGGGPAGELGFKGAELPEDREIRRLPDGWCRKIPRPVRFPGRSPVAMPDAQYRLLQDFYRAKRTEWINVCQGGRKDSGRLAFKDPSAAAESSPANDDRATRTPSEACAKRCGQERIDKNDACLAPEHVKKLECLNQNSAGWAICLEGCPTAEAGAPGPAAPGRRGSAGKREATGNLRKRAPRPRDHGNRRD